ncbi:MAG: TIGR02117 family protein [Sulfitobacter sp.]|nr:TIGR02117 family protein [Sulfitobacter sp.]
MLGGILSNSLQPDTGQRTQVIYLAKGPIHYDFVLPLDQRTLAAFSTIAYAPFNEENAEHLIIGWGTETFYTTIGGYNDLTGKAIWRAAFGDTSVVHMDVTGALYPDHGLRKITMSDAQYDRFLTEIRNSFDGQSPILRGGFTQTDAFYPAKGKFHILRTCNVWVGSMLRGAGLRFGVWTPLPLSVTLSHRLYQPA